MPQSGLTRVFPSGIATAKKKFTPLVPAWIANGKASPKPAIDLAINLTKPVLTVSSLSVAANGVASVTNGTWKDSIWGQPTSYQYTWYRDAAPIAGAPNAHTYTLVVADETHKVSCRVGAINAGGTVYVTSNQSGTVTA